MADEKKEAAKPTRTSAPNASGDGAISPADTEALAKAGLSPADLELATGVSSGGDPVIVRQSPETPTQAQVEAASTEVPGPTPTTVTIKDGDSDVEVDLPVDVAVQTFQRAAPLVGHASNRQEGHWSNPSLADMSDEDREKDAAAVKARFG